MGLASFIFHRKLRFCSIFLKFSENLNAAFWENPEKIWSKFSKIQQKFSKILAKFAKFAKFCKNQQKIQQFLTKKLRLENVAKECIL